MMNVALTPIEESFFFDVPEGFSQIKNFLIDKGIKTESDLKSLSADELKTFETLKEVSYFHGFLDMLEDASYKQSYLNQKWPLFKKIKEGEVLRLFTPVFLHGSILHILFNMLWIFVLMKQIEAKLGILKTGALALILAMISNTCQYLVSGPFFVGASGIIVGLAAFIWIRQKKAPWEGYIFSKTLIVFLMVYVLSLVILSMGIVVFNISNHKNLAFGIANTAHVAGGLCGLFLGLTKIFRRR
jgi:GlpG protein